MRIASDGFFEAEMSNHEAPEQCDVLKSIGILLRMKSKVLMPEVEGVHVDPVGGWKVRHNVQEADSLDGYDR